MTEIIFTGITAKDLLDQIGNLIETKIKDLLPRETNQSKSEYFSRKEVCALLKISFPTLHEWTKLKWLKSYKIGSRVLYKKAEVEDALNKVTAMKHKKGGKYGP